MPSPVHFRGGAGVAGDCAGAKRVTAFIRLAAAGCVAAALIAGTPTHALTVGAYHILPLPHYYAQTKRLPPGGGDGPLYYYGGSVFSSCKVVSVIWGKSANQQT